MYNGQTLQQPLTTHQFESMSGVNTSVIFEFIHPYRPTESIFVKVDSVITIAYSVYKSNIPVYLLGENMVSGFGLGNKVVGGSIIKTLTYKDELIDALSFYQSTAIKYKDEHAVPNLGSKLNISIKDFESLMRDDMPEFNIYMYSMSEYTGKTRMDAIYGVKITNTGQVQSIENLITENTLSFVARNIKQANEIGSDGYSIPSVRAVPTVSQILGAHKI